MKPHFLKFYLLALLVSLFLAGCSLFNTPSAPTPLPTLVQATPTLVVLPSPTVISVPPTATPIPATPIPATPTSSPTPPVPTAVPVRFNFAPGTTAGSVKGTLLPGQTQNIVFNAGQGQLTFITADSPNKDATISLSGTNGQVLITPSQKWTSWKGYLPSTQDYIVQVTGGATTENYEVTFVMPVRISFAIGATSGGVKSSLSPYQVQSYVLSAGAGVPMIVTAKNPNVTLAIFGASDGTTLVPAWSATKGYPGWQGILPSTQDYVVQVIAPTSAQSYKLIISIPARISFASGATSATVSGATVKGNVVEYAAQAGAGQMMDLVLHSTNGPAVLLLYGLQTGQWLLFSNQGKTTFSITLPATQDYIIGVVPTSGTVVNYTLTVTIH
jgi:hypothetical protein